MKLDNPWVKLVKGILRAEMSRRGVTYEQRAEIGAEDTALNIRNKVTRGGSSAVFFVQYLKAMGCRAVKIEDD